MAHAMDTRLVHGGRQPASDRPGPVNPPVVRASTVVLRDSHAYDGIARERAEGGTVSGYGRSGLETHRALEEALCALEGGSHAFLTPSGLSAVSMTLLALLAPGDHLLVTDSVYEPVRKLDANVLQRIGVQVTYFNPARTPVQDALQPNTRVVYAETPGSLLMEVVDLPAIAAGIAGRGITLVADNTWGAGYLFNPIAHGADVSLQACTKYIGGHSDLMQGAVVAANWEVGKRLRAMHESLGLCVSADDAYTALRGLRTLGVRLQRHEHNATAVARFLQAQPEVRKVHYPALESHAGHAVWKRDFRGANGLLAVEFSDWSERQIRRFSDSLRLFATGASWGGFESLTWFVGEQRLQPQQNWRGRHGAVRLHIGFEDPEDLKQDIRQALDLANEETA